VPAARAILDRLLRHAGIIHINGRSYRFMGDTEHANMESKPCLYISGCVEAALEQFSNFFRDCAAWRPSEAINASHSSAISASEGKLFRLTRRFVSAIACLSKDEILVASA